MLRADIQFETVLAGVAGPGDDGRKTCDCALEVGCVIAGGDLVLRRQFLKDGLCLRALQCQLGDGLGNVLDLHVPLDLRFDPGKVLVLVGRVDHDEIIILLHLVDDQIVHHAAFRIAHR